MSAPAYGWLILVVLRCRYQVTSEPRVQRPDDLEPPLQRDEGPEDQSTRDSEHRTDADSNDEHMWIRSRAGVEDQEWDGNHQQCPSKQLNSPWKPHAITIGSRASSVKPGRYYNPSSHPP